MINQNKQLAECEGEASGPISNRLRFPPRKEATNFIENSVGKSLDTVTTAGTGRSSATCVVTDGPGLIEAMDRNREYLPKMQVAAEQLDVIIEFVKSKSNISKDLKTSLLKLRQSVLAAKQDYEKAKEQLGKVEGQKDTRSCQTEVFSFTGNANISDDIIRYAMRKREASGDEYVAKRRMVAKGKVTYAAVLQSGKAGTSQAPRSRGHGNKGEANTNPKAKKAKKKEPRVNRNQAVHPQEPRAQGNSNPWIRVGNKKKQRKPKTEPKESAKPKTAKRRNLGEALVIKTEEAKYAEVLKAMRSTEKLSPLGADVRSIRRTRIGEMILVLKKDAKEKGAVYKQLAQEVLGDEVDVRSLTAEATLQCKNLDEVTDAAEVSAALKEQCDIDVASKAIHLRKGPQGTQVAAIRLPVAEANKAKNLGILKVGWSVCRLSIQQPPEVCFKCFGKGHKSWNCNGPDRSKMCRKCGAEGHRASDCKQIAKCLICVDRADNGHLTGGPKCPGTSGVSKQPKRK